MDVVKAIAKHKIVAIVRLDDLFIARQLTEALVAGGIRIIEFTLTNPAAIETITQIRRLAGADVAVGAGSVVSIEQVSAVADAGAQFVVSPVSKAAVIAVPQTMFVQAKAVSTLQAVLALAAGSDRIDCNSLPRVQPCRLCPGSQLDNCPGNLMPQYRRELGWCSGPAQNLDVSRTDAGGPHLHYNLSGAGTRPGHISDSNLVFLVDHRCLHRGPYPLPFDAGRSPSPVSLRFRLPARAIHRHSRTSHRYAQSAGSHDSSVSD
jgi:hypothetical protein